MSLPQWQRELLADPGWDQPAIAQMVETPMPAPSHERLLAEQTRVAQSGIISHGRTFSGKSASWLGGGPPPPDYAIQQGEFAFPAGSVDCGSIPNAAQCWQCQGNRVFELNIQEAPSPGDGQVAISFVEKGVSASNHFNTTGGSSNNGLCAIYQIFSSKRTADPQQPYSPDSPKFTEISYRADGGPAPNGQMCDANAFLVKDFIWWKYNQQNFNALPGLNTTALYNILIAPSSDESEADASSADSTARYQSFYMGSLNEALYGGAQIVSIESSTSNCQAFRHSIANNRLFFTNPIYGVLLKRWQDSVLDSMQSPNNNPWDGDFGWPVTSPIAFNNGASTLSARGAYYAWGQYFERGFIWWVDYINNTNVPDEAQAFHFTGDNVFCKSAGEKFEKMPTIYYGGTGPLGVCVVVEASLSADGRYYEVAQDDGDPPLLDMHAHGYGSTPRASDGHYKHYTWVFRDGTTLTNDTPYDDSTKYVTHAYAVKTIYTPRVQVIDANGLIAYGDSLPIHVGDKQNP